MQAQAIKADDQWSQYFSHNIGICTKFSKKSSWLKQGYWEDTQPKHYVKRKYFDHQSRALHS